MKSRIKKQRRDYHGKFTSRPTWKERFIFLTILLGGIGFGYHLHINSVICADSLPITEVRDEQPATPSAEVQTISLPEPKELTEKEQIIAYVVEVFGEDSVEALMIARCESTLDPSRIGDEDIMLYDSIYDEMVGDSIGLFQIRTGGKGWNRARANGMTADEFRANLKEYKYNVDYAKTIFDRGQWSAWTCKKVL